MCVEVHDDESAYLQDELYNDFTSDLQNTLHDDFTSDLQNTLHDNEVPVREQDAGSAEASAASA
jgi:hypothetical protein